MFSGITLSSAQQTQLDAIHQTFAVRYKAFVVNTNAVLKAAKRRPGPTERAAADQLRQENVAAMRAVLTPAQQAQFDLNVQKLQTSADSVRRALAAAHATQTGTLVRPTTPMTDLRSVLAPAPSTATGHP